MNTIKDLKEFELSKHQDITNNLLKFILWSRKTDFWKTLRLNKQECVILEFPKKIK